MDAPTQNLGGAFYYKAFCDLSSCRSIGMSEGEIPWTAAKEYAFAYGMDEFQFNDLWTIVKEMDLVYLEINRKKQDKSLQDAQKGAKSGHSISRPS